MNKLEYESVLEALGLNTKEFKSHIYKLDNYSYYWNNFRILYNKENQLSEIRGTIPYEVARNIYKNYPDLRKHISALPTIQDIDPIKIARNNELEKFTRITNEVLNNDVEKSNKVISSKKTALLNEDINSFYLNNYYTNSKEGLMVLMSELQNYYLNKIIPNSNELSTKEERLINLYSKTLNIITDKVSPYFKPQEWSKNRCSTYNDSSDSYLLKDDLDEEIDDVLKSFDMAINPFSKGKDSIIDPIDYSNKIKIYFDKDEDTFDIHIRDFDNNNIAHFYKSKDELIYSLFIEEEDKHIHIQHTIGYLPHFSNERYEKILISELPKKYDIDKNISLEYDLVNYRFINSKEDPTTLKTKLLDYLYNATLIGESLTLNNMTKTVDEKVKRKV